MLWFWNQEWLLLQKRQVFFCLGGSLHRPSVPLLLHFYSLGSQNPSFYFKFVQITVLYKWYCAVERLSEAWCIYNKPFKICMNGKEHDIVIYYDVSICKLSQREQLCFLFASVSTLVIKQIKFQGSI
jgi:hypothetical protein